MVKRTQKLVKRTQKMVNIKQRGGWVSVADAGLKEGSTAFAKQMVPSILDDVSDAVTDEAKERLRPIDDDKLFQKTERFYSSEEFWDALYDDPCWIDPATDRFSLSKLSTLWCNWYSNVPEKVEKIVGTAESESIDMEKLQTYYEDIKGGDGDEYSIFDDIYSDGDAFALGGAWPKFLTSLAKYKDDIKDWEPDEETKIPKLEDSLKILNISMNEIKDNGLLKEGDDAWPWFKKFIGGGSDCDYTKWFFCLIFKLILGPAGLLILKMLPPLVKFINIIRDFFGKIIISIHNSRPSILPDDKISAPWYNNKGEVRFYKPGVTDALMSYLGLVIPFGAVSNKRGQVWGNGEFGKFIFGLVMVSVGLITMGGLSVLVLLTAFLYYCGKTLSMFTSNIEPKKKK
uniref:Uncharacterized protein n=1 Tax=viral metagenome TaxID=1070528 RepID=A0A6C0JCP0_9ZZZZ